MLIAKRTIVATALALAALLAVVTPGATAAEPAPAWSLTVVSYPTVFPKGLQSGSEGQGPGYLVIARNVGGAPTAGPFTIFDTLPAGLEPSAGVLPTAQFSASGEFINCGVEGLVVSCEGDGSEAVAPGESIYVKVPVDVPALAPDQVTDEAEVSGGGVATARMATTVTHLGSDIPSFGFLEGSAGLSTNATAADGSTTVEAGSHPYQASVTVGFPTRLLARQSGSSFSFYGVGEPKDIGATLPRGFYVDPDATAERCRERQLEGPGCPLGSEVGIATSVIVTGGPIATSEGVYNMVPPPGVPAEFAFEAAAGVYVHLFGHVNSAGEYELSASSPNTPAKVPVLGASVSFWGSPTDASHDSMRGFSTGGPGNNCKGHPVGKNQCPVERRTTALLTLPGDCSGSPLTTSAEADSWLEPGVFDTRSALSTDLDGNPVAISGCSALQFAPTISARPTEAEDAPNPHADSPTGLDFDLHQPQHLGYEELATANLRDARVSLPAGVSLDPSAANGLGVCTEAQIGRLPDEDGKLRFSEEAQSCPDAAKIGTLKVHTPLLEHDLPGSIYVAEPYRNPFGTLLAIYLAIEDEESGIVAKLAGRVDADPVTGRLTATFTESPELPIEDIDLHFFEGPAAPLKTPLACGTYTTTSTLVPWSAPEAPGAEPTSSFATGVAASGHGPCPTSEAAAPNAPAFGAGTVTPAAGSYSPFVLKLARADGDQQIAAIDTTLPAGLTGRLAGIPYCPEAAIAAAKAREAPDQGALEQASPSCPAASLVGTVTVSAGAGPAPYYASGKAYWAGPYKGAPLSMVIIAPAVAGPFDLGNVVSRVALYVNEYSAQIHAVSDPLPRIIQGIPLDLRSISLDLDRPGFVLNPTNCQPGQITGTSTSPTGAAAPLAARFQVGGCDKLKFKPKLKISLKGQTKRTGHPALKAVLTYPSQGAYANIARAQVGLPHSEFLDQGNIGKACTKALLAQRACPAKSIYGKAKAWTPLLEKPLEGPVYLVGGYGYKLPALVAELNGQIRVLLVGKVDTGPTKGIRNTFEAVPDAPVSRFVLEMKGGPKYGLLENSEDICKKAQRAAGRFTAQNGIVDAFRVKIGNSCKGEGHKKPKKHHD